MEFSVLGAGLQPLLPRSLPSSSSSSSSSSSLTHKPSDSRLSFAAQTVTTLVKEQPSKSKPTTTKKSPLSNSYSARQSAISQVQRSSDLASALSRLEAALQVQDLNTMFRYFGAQKRWRELSQIFYWMKQNGKISPPSYSTYIKFMGESFNPIGALEIYNGICRHGYAHSIMIAALCRGGLFEDAKRMAKDFELTFDKYDLVMLNTMLCAYCRAGDMESVMEMLKRMDELAISPDRHTFHILIRYFCKEKMYLLAYRMTMDMHNKGHGVEEELCSSLMFHLGKMKAHGETFSVYNLLRHSKSTMCKAIHEKILHILIGGGLLKDAYVVVKDNGESISTPAREKFASAFAKSGNINLINDVLKVVHGFGGKVDQEIFGTAITRYVMNPEKKDLLLQLLRWMSGHGYVVDSPTRNLILKNSDLFGRQAIVDILSKQQIMSKSLKSNKSRR